MPSVAVTPIDPSARISKSFAAGTLGVDLKARTVRHWVTTPSLDEEGEVLLPRGADMSRFGVGGTVFDGHKYDSRSVVGKCVKYEITDKGHVATTQFAERPPTLPATERWEPDVLLWMYHTGNMKGWSIGMNGLGARNPSKKDMEDYGGECRRVWTKYRVLEYSCAPLPMNGDALTFAAKGMISKPLADVLAKGELPSVEMFPAPEPVASIVTNITDETIFVGAAVPLARKAIPEEEIVIFSCPVPKSRDRTSDLVRARLTGRIHL